MAPKKAAKHAAKKHAPKKAAKKAAGHKNDTQRCYEHFGRVTALLGLLSEDQRELLMKLASLAQQLLRQDEAKAAADALRAAEHIAFGRIAATQSGNSRESMSEPLRAALEGSYAHMLERAEEHVGDHEITGPVLAMYRAVRREADAAHRAGQMRAAVEFARGAEALSHVETPLTARLRTTDMKSLEQA